MNGQMKIVYHQEWLDTHALRFAKKNEKAENPYGWFVTPTLTSWNYLTGDNISNAEMRKKLNSFNYGSATIPMMDGKFLINLDKFKPSKEYPTFGAKGQEECRFTSWFSEEMPNSQTCPAGYVVTGIKCSGDYCDSKQLKCCKISGLKMSGSVQATPYFSEEKTNFYMNDARVLVGMQCRGSYCDKISLLTRKTQQTKGIWLPPFSEESGQGNCYNGGYVAGVKCSGRYCDNISLYCKE